MQSWWFASRAVSQLFDVDRTASAPAIYMYSVDVLSGQIFAGFNCTI